MSHLIGKYIRLGSLAMMIVFAGIKIQSCNKARYYLDNCQKVEPGINIE